MMGLKSKNMSSWNKSALQLIVYFFCFFEYGRWSPLYFIYRNSEEIQITIEIQKKIHMSIYSAIRLSSPRPWVISPWSYGLSWNIVKILFWTSSPLFYYFQANCIGSDASMLNERDTYRIRSFILVYCYLHAWNQTDAFSTVHEEVLPFH